jgi:hypothetical protein
MGSSALMSIPGREREYPRACRRVTDAELDGVPLEPLQPLHDRYFTDVAEIVV